MQPTDFENGIFLAIASAPYRMLVREFQKEMGILCLYYDIFNSIVYSLDKRRRLLMSSGICVMWRIGFELLFNSQYNPPIPK